VGLRTSAWELECGQMSEKNNSRRKELKIAGQSIQPRGELVLIAPYMTSLRSADVVTRIILPDIAKEPSRCGRVLAVGPKVHDIEQGMDVIFRRYAGVEFRSDEGDRQEFDGLRLMKQDDILCIVKGVEFTAQKGATNRVESWT